MKAPFTVSPNKRLLLLGEIAVAEAYVSSYWLAKETKWSFSIRLPDCPQRVSTYPDSEKALNAAAMVVRSWLKRAGLQ